MTKVCAKTCWFKALQPTIAKLCSVNIIVFIKESLCMPHIQRWIQKSSVANDTNTYITNVHHTVIQQLSKTAEASTIIKPYSLWT